ncbi:MAG: hypothetical protein COT71_02465 [Candidatus Andersenbacteria bacterium CG10_big_fil_rev_8_21_14_0_10_54_11]|uniref:AFP-like domain-containing protein n=1 Tax=Candidatus Andersenbacteria bacterium CG10_big_fil_rev_8_21_14_0_10_54_11 TaxID=1974485 RepID=A0A2M6WZ69_9BACT|nr:MAG: hypothetical protein COT71_02465 [Candidatus Andersenbacteria bacterium CG10_big_fil_rev_8_21_14_0_10_54_11]
MDLWDRLQAETPFLVAEIGKNFIQTERAVPAADYLANALALVDAAASSGADAVKFQTHVVDDEQAPLPVVAPHFNGADRYSWVRRNTEVTPPEFWRTVKHRCAELGVVFFSTPMSRRAAQRLVEADVPLWKVSSGDILDFVLLDFLRRRSEPIIISSGMSTLAEVDLAIRFLRENTSKIVLLHCISKYPADPQEMQLGVIPFFQQRYGIPIGFSDHSLGWEAALGAAAIGTRVIEKHFSLSRDLWGSDHKVSMTPAEFAEMARRVRDKKFSTVAAELFMGDPVADELPDAGSEFRGYFRKSLVAARNITTGEVIEPDMLYAMRPQALLGGLPSERYEEVVGQQASASVSAGHVLLEEAVSLGASRERRVDAL